VSAVFASLALLSLALLLWQWAVARRFPLHRRVAAPEFPPAVTLLKPLKGCDATSEASLRSWFAQDYTGRVQILFGVASESDPVCVVARKLMADFPNLDAQLVICGPLLGANAKVSKLMELEKLAKHDVLVISDADVRVPPDFLSNVAVPLTRASAMVPEPRAPSPRPSPPMGERGSEVHVRGEVGLVNCFYRLANPTTLAMQWEAIAINADFWSQVLQGASLRKLDFALGAVMVTRRKQLEELGGFATLVNCLADDYQLGNRIARRGYRIEFSPVVVECWSEPMGWRAVWKHQLRWARTIRVCQPLPYFFSILANVTFWALVCLIACWLSVTVSRTGVAGEVAMEVVSGPVFIIVPFICLAARIFVAHDLQKRLTRTSAHITGFWLVPAKDLLQAALWFCAFTGRQIEWRGDHYRLNRDGTLKRA
jgi:ceramide glucosyltransferase